MLTENEIFFASPPTLDDPEDCKRIPQYHIATTHDKRRALRRRSKGDFPRLNRKARWDKVEQILETGPHTDPEHVRGFQEEYWGEYIAKQVGVFSLSATKESVRLWEEYAENHTGFCVGFDARELKREFEGDRIAVLGPVRYVKGDWVDPPLGREDDSKWMIGQLTTKRETWKYQEEWRGIVVGTTILPCAVEDATMVEVVLGSKMPDEHKVEIRNCLAAKPHRIPVFQARLSEDASTWQFDPLDC